MTTLEEKAFLDALYADNSEDLKKFLLKLTLNPDITDDVLQETFCEACKKAEKLMVHPCPRGWLFITARLKLKEQLKLHKKFYPDTQIYDLTGINIQSQLADIEFRESLKLFLPDLEYKMLILSMTAQRLHAKKSRTFTAILKNGAKSGCSASEKESAPTIGIFKIFSKKWN